MPLHVVPSKLFIAYFQAYYIQSFWILCFIF